MISLLSSDAAERSPFSNDDALGYMWLLTHAGSTVLGCRCLESSRDRVRLELPPGYGIAVGQEYELRPKSPDETSMERMPESWLGCAFVRIVSARERQKDGVGRLDVEAVRLPADANCG
jgi:hypothetical protein